MHTAMRDVNHIQKKYKDKLLLQGRGCVGGRIANEPGRGPDPFAAMSLAFIMKCVCRDVIVI